MSSVLIVRNDPACRKTLANLLARSGCRVVNVEKIEEAKRRLETDSFDLVITDLCLGAGSGMEVLTAAKKAHVKTEIIVVAASKDIALAIEAIKKGAYDYIVEPFQDEEILLKIDRALERINLRSEVRLLRQEMAQQLGFDNIIGTSKAIVDLKNVVARIANTDEAVLIIGESGTGKELLSKIIHYHSERRDKPFISINCSAVPEEFLESELLGHVKGAFDSAAANKCGLFEDADGGTVFLDEVADLPDAIQTKLLHLFRNKEISSTGGKNAKPVDVRVIAATKTNLLERVQNGRFLEELYYRLNVMSIYIPPLRERSEDIVPMAEYFLRNMKHECSRSSLSLSRDGLEILLEHHWPGNVRELENTLKRAVTLSTGNQIGREEIVFVSPRMTGLMPRPGSRREKRSLQESQKLQILKSLEENNWNYSLTAGQLGIGRTTLWRKIKKFNLGKAELPGRHQPNKAIFRNRINGSKVIREQRSPEEEMR